MIRNSYLGCQYRDLLTNFQREWIEHPGLVRQRGYTQLKTWRSDPFARRDACRGPYR